MWQKISALVLLTGVILLSTAVSTELSVGANLRSIVIVLGGTFLGALIAYSVSQFKELVFVLRSAFTLSPTHPEVYVDQIVRLARVSRFRGARALDALAHETENDFLRLGMELVADGKDHREIRDVLEKEYELYFNHRDSQINMLQTMARLAPAFGLAGTLIGLMKMFSHLTDTSGLGVGMSVALLTTFYGIMIGNLLFLPLARKLKEFTRREAVIMALILEGTVGILEQEHPSNLDHRLRALFLNRRSQVLASLKTSGTDDGLSSDRPGPRVQVLGDG